MSRGVSAKGEGPRVRIGQNGTTALHIQIDIALFDRLAARAHAEDRSLSQMARRLLKRALDAPEPE